MIYTLIIVLLILAVLGFPGAPVVNRGWGYGPSGALGLVILILLILVLSGRL